MFDLSGKTALVTGASGGLGQAIARALHGCGAQVGLSGTRREALDALAAELATNVHVLPCDLADKTAVEALVPAAEAALGSIDILVNNAGLTKDNLFLRMKDEEWDMVLAVNLTAAFRLSRACLKGMLKKRFGRIIGISSVVGVTGNAGQGNYAASKAGMIGMYKSLAAEVASRNVTVNCIAPGFIESPMTAVLGDKQTAAILANVPMGRLGTGAEVDASVDVLADLYRRALSHPDVIGISVGTRPDAFSAEALELLTEIARTRYVCLELGLQSMDDVILSRINRGHTLDEFLETVRRSARHNFDICAHLIYGFPGELPGEFLKTADLIASLSIDSIKLHQLHAVEGTELAEMYRRGEFIPLSLQEYVSTAADFLERLPARVTVQRLYGSAPLAISVAPRWGLKNNQMWFAVINELRRRGTWQGCRVE